MFDLQSAKLLFAAAEELQLNPEWLTDYGLFSIRLNGNVDYIFYGTSLLNSSIHSYLAKNKHATRTILSKNKFLNIPYCLPKSLAEATAFFKEHQLIIAKPTLGQHSENVRLINSAAELTKINLNADILEKFITGKEYRCLVLKGEVIAIHHKQYDTPINNPEKVHRLSLPTEAWNITLVETAVHVAEVMHLRLAAVDFMIDESGQQFILEVNSSPGIARFHYPYTGPSIDFAGMLLEAVVEERKKLVSVPHLCHND